jgi:hypothetical protein
VLPSVFVGDAAETWACAKVTILKAASRLEWLLPQRSCEAATGEAYVKA